MTDQGKRDAGLGHGGDVNALAARAGCEAGRLLDFSASINPLGPPEYLRRVISRRIEKLGHYPDPHSRELLVALAERYGMPADCLLAANGSTEIIYAVPRAFNVRRAVIPVPSYLDYERASRQAGLEILQVPLSEADEFRFDAAALVDRLRVGDLVWLGSPNNPTGLACPAAQLLPMVASHPEVLFVVDESFIEFVTDESGLLTAEMPPNLIVVRSLTKFYAIPGLRLGFAASSAENISGLHRQILPWTVNVLAQELGRELLADREYPGRSRDFVREMREELTRELSNLPGLKVFPGQANFLLVKLERDDLTATELAERLLAEACQPVAIRVCDNFAGLDQRFFRVAVRGREENDELCRGLARELAPGSAPAFHGPRRTPALMLQGTASNAGKSVLTAALGRIMLQDGYRVAPFKAQNMSLNSFVTRDGGEMGRAQVVQAQACRLDPEVRMNPVLLKPSSDVGCQVIVNGLPVGNMTVDNYIDYKPLARKAACTAYDSLAAEFEVMLLEGAGSPAEVNLKRHDIVNMGMARHAGAQVLLVGDIDRGGVFASFIGTLEVMEEWERRLVAGFVVNRFRGQADLLGGAFDYVLNFTGKPVVGTVPYIHDHGLPEEDSVSFKEGLYERGRPAGEHVVIGVVDLPYISNFTDVEPFLAEPDVYLRIIKNAAELDRCSDELAALILPGSKNVISDLAWLRQSGMAERLVALAGSPAMETVGICGGFQMLGDKIADPHRLESTDGTEVAGLGLLAMTTTLAPEKTLTRRDGIHLSSRLKVHGYEIHHGRTTSNLNRAVHLADGDEDGAVSSDGRIWGTYLHGIFDDDDFRRSFIDMLRTTRLLPPLGRVAAPYDLEPAFDRLAAVVRESLDMKRIYRLLGL